MVENRRPEPHPRYGSCDVPVGREWRAWSCLQHNLASDGNSRVAVHASEVVVSGARSFGRDHARPNGRLRRAGGTEDLALPGFDDPLQDLTALPGLRIGHSNAGNPVEHLGIEFFELAAELERALGDEPQASPFEVRSELEDLVQYRERLRIAFFAYNP